MTERADPLFGTAFCTRTIANVFDWSLLETYDPKLLEMQGDTEGMSRIMSAIVNCNWATDPQICHNHSIVKLMQLAQVVLKYMLKCQDELKEQLHDQEAYATELNTTLKETKKKSKKVMAVAQKVRRSERCPACGRSFESSSYLDSHMKRRHGYVYDAWIAIRKNEPCLITIPEERMQAQIDDLQKKVAKIEKKQRVEVPPPPAPAALSGPVMFKPTSERELHHDSDNDVLIAATQPIPRAKKSELEVTGTFTIPRKETQDKKKKKHVPDNVKERAKQFLFRSTIAPVKQSTINQIVGSITERLHEQAKPAGLFSESDPDEVHNKIEADLEATMPMTSKRAKNSLVEARKKQPALPAKQTRPRKDMDDKNPRETAEKKPEPRKTAEEKKPDAQKVTEPKKTAEPENHIYGDSMPLTDVSAHMEMSDFGEYISATDFVIPERLTQYSADKSYSKGANKSSQHDTDNANPDTAKTTEPEHHAESPKPQEPMNKVPTKEPEQMSSNARDEPAKASEKIHSNSQKESPTEVPKSTPNATEVKPEYSYYDDDEELPAPKPAAKALESSLFASLESAGPPAPQKEKVQLEEFVSYSYSGAELNSNDSLFD